jgi:hypothetical protein
MVLLGATVYGEFDGQAARQLPPDPLEPVDIGLHRHFPHRLSQRACPRYARTHAHAMVGHSALGVKMTRSQTNAEVDRRSTTTPRPTQLPSVSAPSPAIGAPAWSFPSPQPTGAHHTTHTHHHTTTHDTRDTQLADCRCVSYRSGCEAACLNKRPPFGPDTEDHFCGVCQSNYSDSCFEVSRATYILDFFIFFFARF